MHLHTKLVTRRIPHGRPPLNTDSSHDGGIRARWIAFHRTASPNIPPTTRSETAFFAGRAWPLVVSSDRYTSPQEMVMKNLAKPHPRNTLVWGQCAIEAISCGKCTCSVLPTSQSFSSHFPGFGHPHCVDYLCVDDDQPPEGLNHQACLRLICRRAGVVTMAARPSRS